uniref:Uncharacterized protein n=1 Tax=Kalanchoe fedtschenkoi TaxID=63787 RepID=A0A7N0ZV29_KALFE
MGKKGSWFSKVKKALTPHSKENTEQKLQKPKKKWFVKQKEIPPPSAAAENAASVSGPPYPENVNFSGAENEQSKHAYSVALATAAAAEAAVAAAQAAAEVVRLTSVSRYIGKTREEVAAIRIQTAFRGHMARRALRALKGLVRLKSMINGQSVLNQATTTLRYMQTLAYVQSQIRARRNRMSEENQALKRQLQQKHEKELERLRFSGGENWNDSQHSKEKIEARLLSKQEATMRRERALAYAYSHQTVKNSLKSEQFTFLDPNNPQWGWSWIERWMAARPWESRSIIDKEVASDRGSIKSSSSRKLSVGEISNAYYTRIHSSHESINPTSDFLKANRSANGLSASTLPTKAPPSSSSATRKIRSASTKGSAWAREDDSRSVFSVQSERCRRHSVAGSSATDDESLVSTPSVPSYMAPTESVKARSRFSPMSSDKKGSPGEVSSVGPVKKRLSFPASPAGVRRHSGPPLVRAGN